MYFAILKKAALFSALRGLRFSDIEKRVCGELEFIKGQGYFINLGKKNQKELKLCLFLIKPSANPYTFGVLCSSMQMAWTRTTCGRLKSDYRYSASIVYNNFPLAENVSEKQKEAVEKAAQAVLDARAQFPNASLADLYDPNKCGGIGQGTSGIRQSRRPLLSPPAITQRNHTNRVPLRTLRPIHEWNV